MKRRFAADLSADLGYGRHMPPAFWAWCDRWGLPRQQSWDWDEARAAVDRSRGLA